jgi:hypothetical protein
MKVLLRGLYGAVADLPTALWVSFLNLSLLWVLAGYFEPRFWSLLVLFLEGL